jgi:hypothetical protein
MPLYVASNFKTFDRILMGPLTSKASVFLVLALASATAQVAPTTKAISLAAGKGAQQQAKSASPEEFKMPDPVPIPSMSSEELPASAPSVSYRSGKLLVDADNATLGEILNLIGKEIGAQIEKPAAADRERTAAHLSGSPARVLATLLDDGKFNYIILYPPQQPDHVQKVILTTQTQDPVRPALGVQRTAISRTAATQIDPGPTPESQPYPNGSTDTSAALASTPAARPDGSQLQENMAHAQDQLAKAMAEAQLPSNSSGADNPARPSPNPDAAAQSGDKSPMQVLQDLYQVRKQLQLQQNQSQKPSQNQ